MIISSKLVVSKSSAETKASELRARSWPLAVGTSGPQPTLGAGSLLGPQEQQTEGLVGLGEDGTMPPFFQQLTEPARPWASERPMEPHTGLFPREPRARPATTRREEAFFPADQRQGSQKSISSTRGLTFVQEIEAWEPRSWEGKCITLFVRQACSLQTLKLWGSRLLGSLPPAPTPPPTYSSRALKTFHEAYPTGLDTLKLV